MDACCVWCYRKCFTPPWGDWDVPDFSCDVTYVGSQNQRVVLGLTDLGGTFSDRKFFCLPEQSREMLAIGLAGLTNYRRVWVRIDAPQTEWSDSVC
jgi:hypothetical protein